MYDRNVAITGSTIEKTTRYDRFREDNIRMELYRIILALYDEGYRMFSLLSAFFIRSSYKAQYTLSVSAG